MPAVDINEFFASHVADGSMEVDMLVSSLLAADGSGDIFVLSVPRRSPGTARSTSARLSTA